SGWNRAGPAAVDLYALCRPGRADEFLQPRLVRLVPEAFTDLGPCLPHVLVIAVPVPAQGLHQGTGLGGLGIQGRGPEECLEVWRDDGGKSAGDSLQDGASESLHPPGVVVVDEEVQAG